MTRKFIIKLLVISIVFASGIGLLNQPSFAQESRNFRTHLELDIAAPVVNAFQQVVYGGGAGGPSCTPELAESYEYLDTIRAGDLTHFKSGDRVELQSIVLMELSILVR